MTPEDRVRRRFSIGGSDANIIARGDKAEIDQLWREKRGESGPADVRDGILAVAMGTYTEEFNRRWFERETGLSVGAAVKLPHPAIPWLSATPDGYVFESAAAGSAAQAVFEAKHVNPFNFDMDRVLANYMPQLQHNMFVTGIQRAVLSVFVGTMKWAYQWVDFDPVYHAELLAAERAFWLSVKNGTPPDGWSVGDPPQVGRVDLTGDPNFQKIDEAYRIAKKALDQATEKIRAMVPPNAREVVSGGIVVKRDARGTPRIAVKGDA